MCRPQSGPSAQPLGAAGGGIDLTGPIEQPPEPFAEGEGGSLTLEDLALLEQIYAEPLDALTITLPFLEGLRAFAAHSTVAALQGDLEAVDRCSRLWELACHCKNATFFLSERMSW